MPHTVQFYGWDDPAPTYGNVNFTYMFDFMFYEAEQNKDRQPEDRRFIVYHPETAYWVSYDSSVPLGLPLYGERRLYDLRYIAQEEEQRGIKIDGQNDFDSGWEWSYWFQDIITGRAAWDPSLSASTQQDAFVAAMEPFKAAFGEGFVDAMVQAVEDQKRLLIEGAVSCDHWLRSSSSPWDSGVDLVYCAENPRAHAQSSVVKLNGIAYLEGWGTYQELQRDFTGSTTQPDKVFYSEVSNATSPSYAVLRPLLADMAATFKTNAAAFAPLVSAAPTYVAELVEDIRDSMNITALRAEFVLNLYDAAFANHTTSQRIQALAAARNLLTTAAEVVANREKNYKVPVERIGGWRGGPTSYQCVSQHAHTLSSLSSHQHCAFAPHAVSQIHIPMACSFALLLVA